MKHGLAGFQRGCRCSDCHDAETGRLQRINKAQEDLWRPINSRADLRWAISGHEPEDWSAADIELALRPSWTIQRIAEYTGHSMKAVREIRRQYLNPPNP